MGAKLQRNREFLRDLFAGPFTRHGVIAEPPLPGDFSEGDFITSDKPVSDWVPLHLAVYEGRLRWHELLDDDSVPFATLRTGTEVFAAAFGCPTHVYEDSPPCAMPLVRTAEEADRLAVPELDCRPVERVFQIARQLRERLGPDVPVGVPDVQSPFDIAALIWRKEDMFVALHQEPDAVRRLVEKCRILLERFLQEYMREFPNCCLSHCPYVWAPPELGCWLSEDEAGSLSEGMFSEFCSPPLEKLSRRFGGLFVHCCATADHQYMNFRRLPNLRGLNRVFQAPGPRPAIEAFAGETVLMQAWIDDNYALSMLQMAQPASRFLFCLAARDLDRAKEQLDRLMPCCARAEC